MPPLPPLLPPSSESWLPPAAAQCRAFSSLPRISHSSRVPIRTWEFSSPFAYFPLWLGLSTFAILTRRPPTASANIADSRPNLSHLSHFLAILQISSLSSFLKSSNALFPCCYVSLQRQWEMCNRAVLMPECKWTDNETPNLPQTWCKWAPNLPT